METSCCLRGHGLIILFLSLLSGLALKINCSCDAKDTKINSDQKRILSGEFTQTEKQYQICVTHKPENGPYASPVCNKGYVINEIKFADYGQPTGSCKMFKRGNCGAIATLRLVKKNCLGKEACWLPVTDEMFGPTNCKGPISFAFWGSCTIKK